MMLPTMRNTQLTGWLRKTPMRDRLQAEVTRRVGALRRWFPESDTG